MNNNMFTVQADSEHMIEFLKSSKKTAQMFIEHYEFVIKDLSGEITNRELERTKQPTIEFLTKMLGEWKAFQTAIEEQMQVYGVK